MGGSLQQSLEDAHEADTERDTRQHGDIIRDLLAGSPAEPEKRDDKHRSSDTCKRQPTILLLMRPGSVTLAGAREDAVPDHKDGQGEQAASADGQVHEAAHARREAVEVQEDDGVGLKGHVEDAVAQREVGAAAADDGLEDDHADRAGQHDGGEFRDGLLLELVGRHDAGIWVGLANLAGPVQQEDGTESLGQEQQRQHCEAGVHESDPEGPAPAHNWGGVSRDDGGDQWTEHCCLHLNHVSKWQRLHLA